MNKHIKPVELRRYCVPSEREEVSQGWGVFVIGSDGYFSCVTDYGNYAFCWTATGCDDFRRFLLGADAGYVMNKIGPREEYDGDKTLIAVKQAIIRHRRALDLDADEARREWDLLDDHGRLDTREDFACWAQDTRLDEYWELARTSLPSDIRAFGERLWPRFKQVLRDELAAERTPSPAVAS